MAEKSNYAPAYQNMMSSYKESLKKGPPSRPRGLGSNFSQIPPSRPRGLGSNLPTPEAQIEDVGTANTAIYESFAQTAEANEKMRNEFQKRMLTKTNAPVERPDDYILKGLYKERPNKYFKDLQKEFPDLSLKQISAIVGNLDHESKGFTKFYEEGVSVGGQGDAQWTAGRRRAFRKFIKENNLDPKSYEASRDFLVHELKNDRTHGFVNWPEIDSFNDPSKSAAELAVIFEDRYLRAEVKRLERRKKLAEQYYTEFSMQNRERNR